MDDMNYSDPIQILEKSDLSPDGSNNVGKPCVPKHDLSAL